MSDKVTKFKTIGELNNLDSFMAGTGIRFQLLADDDYEKFYVELDALRQSVMKQRMPEEMPLELETLCKLFDTVYSTISTYKTFEQFLVVRVEAVKYFLENQCPAMYNAEKIFPHEIFEIIKRPMPKLTNAISMPNITYRTNDTELEDTIYIYRDGDKHLICLNETNKILFGRGLPFNSALIGAVVNFQLFYCGNFYFCHLADIDTILTLLCQRVNVNSLQNRFNNQIFMRPTPDAYNPVKLYAKLLRSVDWEDDEFNIYKGIGYGSNAYFVKVSELAQLLHASNNAFYAATDFVGVFEDDNIFYTRLDHVKFIVRDYVCRLWNGENQSNTRIQRAWKFIRWLKTFTKEFFKEQGVEWYGSDLDYFDYEEPTEIENLPPKFEDGYLIARIAELTDVDRNVLAQCILDLREKTFLKRQELLKEHLYDLH